MNRLSRSLLLSFISLFLLHHSLFTIVTPIHASTPAETGQIGAMTFALSKQLTGIDQEINSSTDRAILDSCNSSMMNSIKFTGGETNCDNGVAYSPGLLGAQSKVIAMLYQNQPSSREYIADILDNIGIPQVSSAYAQGTGYSAMSPFLEFWKSFRNLAYSLYIIMFVVVGVMIMLRTKINAQTVITIQSALPNLIITLLLITFSYAIVGFMIDLMYFLIYALVYLISAAGIISTPTKAISRLMSYSAWSVVFEGRNSIISAVSLAIKEILSGVSNLSMGARIGVGIATAGISEILANGFFYLFTAVWLGIAMLKLIFVLFKSYIMLIIQTITAPVQLLMNAMPGSEAFANWLKKTASYLIPFPIAAAMFIMAAVFIGNPTDATILNSLDGRDANPFGINKSHDFYSSWESDQIWLPPFTFTGSNSWESQDLMVLIGFFIFTMTPSVVKMAQDWLQVKESPYASEAAAGFLGLGQTALGYPMGQIKQTRSLHEQRAVQEYGAKKYAEHADKLQTERQAESGAKK